MISGLQKLNFGNETRRDKQTGHGISPPVARLLQNWVYLPISLRFPKLDIAAAYVAITWFSKDLASRSRYIMTFVILWASFS